MESDPNFANFANLTRSYFGQPACGSAGVIFSAF